MKLSNNLDEAILQAKDFLKDKKNIQVNLTVKQNNFPFDTSTIFIRKVNPERIERLKNELIQRFPEKEFDEITMEVSKIAVRKAKCPNCEREMRSNELTRHLKSCVKGNYCPICRKTIDGIVQEHIEQCSRRYYTCNVCGEKFNTGARRTAHEKKCKVLKGATTKTALGGLFKVIELNPNYHPDYEGVFKDEIVHVAEILRHEIKTSLKFYISVEVEISLDESTKTANFQSYATHLYKSSDFEKEVRQHFETITEKIEEYSFMGSGWTVESVSAINIMVTHMKGN